jgi:hypothetical protein
MLSKYSGDIHPRTARQSRTSQPWNGWPRCVPISRNRGEQMVRYYGYYSNVSRGKRQQEVNDFQDDHFYRDPEYAWNDYIQA